jgi:hypothetical protein
MKLTEISYTTDSILSTEHSLPNLMISPRGRVIRGFFLGYDSTVPMAQYPGNPVLLPVEYSNDIPMHSIHDVLQDKMTIASRIATNKGYQWEREKEWRLVFPQPKHTAQMPWPISEIIFGHRMETPHKNAICTLIRTHHSGAAFFDAAPSDDSYKLDMVPYEPAPT